MANPLMKFIIPKFSGSLSRTGVGAGNVAVSDVRELQKRLKAIEPRLRTEFVREVKAIGKPVESAIKSGIPPVAPLSGMNSTGRMGWGVGVAANKTQINFRTKSTGRYLTTSLLRVRVMSPATIVSDMAGKSGRFIGSGYKGSGETRDFDRKLRNGAVITVKRRTSREAGEKFVRNLSANLGATISRFVYPSAEKSMPGVEAEVNKVLARAYDRINGKGF